MNTSVHPASCLQPIVFSYLPVSPLNYQDGTILSDKVEAMK